EPTMPEQWITEEELREEGFTPWPSIRPASRFDWHRRVSDNDVAVNLTYREVRVNGAYVSQLPPTLPRIRALVAALGGE
ncbi:unnamed protein product, partial [Durusdinium trenchii]